MKNNHNVFRKLYNYIKGLTVGNDSFRYAVLYGVISAAFIFAILFSAFFIYGSSKISNPILYFICALLVGLVLIILIVIQRKKIGEENILARIILQAFPFYILIIGSITAFLYIQLADAVFWFFAIVIIISWAQIYTGWKRVFLFGFAFVIFNVIGVISIGSQYLSTGYVEFSIMSVFIAFIAASIHNQIFFNNIEALKKLDYEIQNANLAYKQAESSNKELIKSKDITKAMFEITQEVLKHEKFEDVLQLVLDKAVSLIPDGQAGSILILDDEKIKYVAAKGYLLENLRKIELLPEDLFQATLDDKYQPIIIKNLELYDQTHLGEKKTQKLRDNVVFAKSCLTCAFEYDGMFFGSINVDNFDEEEIFSEYDMYLIKQLAHELELIISIHKLYEQAIRPTKYDELTQARTRTYCIKLLKNLIAVNQKDKIAICTLDVNNLKSVNDKFGHDAGDKYLSFFAKCIRKSEIKDNIFGRIGGDEFLLIFHNLNFEEASKQIEIIRKRMNDNPFKFKKHTEKITFAAGIALYSVDDDNLDNLIKLSDKRMYEDKQVQKQL